MANTVTWKGGASGNFNVGTNWTGGAIPGAADIVVIDNATVDIPNNPTEDVASLQLGANGLLDIGSGNFILGNTQSSTIDGVLLADGALLSLGTGTIVLAGRLDVRGAKALVQTTGPTLEIRDAFSQVGTISMEGGVIGGRVATGGTGTFDTLVLQFETVAGSGVIGLGAGLAGVDELNLVNIGGAIDANVSKLELIMENHARNEGGIFEATNGGTLVLSGLVDQTEVATNEPGSGLIFADASSRVLLDSGIVTAGTLQADSAGTLEVGTKVTIDGGVEVIGLLTVTAGAQLVIDGLASGFTVGGGTIDAGAGSVLLSGGTLGGLDLRAGAGRVQLNGNGNVIGDNTTIEGSLSVDPGQRLTFGLGISGDAVTNSGTINLTGSIDQSAVRHYATLGVNGQFAGNAVALGGGGTIVLGGGTDSSDAGLITGGGSFSLNNIDNTIIGAGSIDNMADLTIGAGATVEAKGGTLFLGAATIDNAGFLGAATGAALVIAGKLNNTNSLGTHGTVIFGGPNAGIKNGTLVAGSTVDIGAPGASFDGLQNEGVIQVLDGAILSIVSALQNLGSVDLAGLFAPAQSSGAQSSGVQSSGAQSSAAGAALLTPGATMEVAGGGVGGSTTLSGGGTITLHQPAVIESAATANRLINLDNTIDGSGSFGGGFLDFVNHGTIDADDATAPLVVNPGTLQGLNLGLMEATTGNLSVQGDVIDTGLIPGGPFPPEFSGVGTLLADGAAAVVGLDGGSIVEGLINSAHGGTVEVRGNETLLLGGLLIPSAGDQQPYASESVLTNYANLGVLAGQTLTLAAADAGATRPVLDNFGSISLDGVGSTGAVLVIAAPTVDLTAEQVGVTSGGDGTLTLGNAADRIVGATGTETLLNNETIAGFGQIGAGALNVHNQALIEATGAAPLIIRPSGTLTQDGTLAINGDGGMVLQGNVDAEFGVMRSLGGTGAFVLDGASVKGGVFDIDTRVLSSTHASTIDGTGNFTQNNVRNFGTIVIQGGQTLAMMGLMTNSPVSIGGTIHSGGTIEVQAGGHLLIGGPTLDLQGFSGGSVKLDGAAAAITGPGKVFVNDGNTISGAGQIGSSDFTYDNFSFFSLVNATGALTINTGTTTVHNAGTLEATAGGSLALSGSVGNSNAIDVTGGTVAIAGALTGSGQVNITGGAVSVGGSVDAGQTISFLSGFTHAETLTLGQPGLMRGTLQFFAQLDTVDLPNVVANRATLVGESLSVFEDTTPVAVFSAKFGAPFYNVIPDGAGGSEIVVACFAAGTRIATPRGEVAVEALRAGDAVLSASGGVAPVRWIGHRRIDCRSHPAPASVWPVRVRAGAFGAAMPARDLLLSPDHSVLAGGALIPARYLINDGSVVQEAVDAITYFHVELPAHGILFAEGLPAESYLDTGNRAAFADTAGVTRLQDGCQSATVASQ